MHLSRISLAFVAAFASTGKAHTVFTTLFINEVNQGDGTCVRMPTDSDTCTNPIAGLQSQDMACGEQHAILRPTSCCGILTSYPSNLRPGR